MKDKDRNVDTYMAVYENHYWRSDPAIDSSAPSWRPELVGVRHLWCSTPPPRKPRVRR